MNEHDSPYPNEIPGGRQVDGELGDSAPSLDEQEPSLCEQKIEYQFRNKDLLHSALTHASGADTRADSNERLEFLGDAILGIVVCEKLFHNFPDYQEGDLTKIKSVVVSRSTCTRISKRIGIEEHLILGKGLSKNNSVPDSLLADVFEALIAAIYLDSGMEMAKEFILRYVEEEIENAVASGTTENFKSILQQHAQKVFGAPPNYLLLSESGPDHNKEFEVAAFVNGEQYESAWGRNKKEAEQKAAFNALVSLEQLDES